ncbi:hypothetical protein QJ854_gp876 [Moumouvirus goulette]|uniref:Uncharacterized protein n=1 Tax=Moumouvirus goulette TaxID=1247379 RepID=M1PLX6_9VIRU|nr:hypothetical protein QJ854_gp876 [Moumouvirus goulette]AGF84906.1 hypothetical protein glt_00097 [Moumouvirus goulette]
MDYKLQKYLDKINQNPKPVYLKKISYYLNRVDNINRLQVGGLKLHNFDSLVDYLQQTYGKATTQTEKKYLVILYGPPASGKSISRYIACHWIKTLFEEPSNIEDIYKSFIDTGIDDITYETESETGKRVIELLKENLNDKLGGDKTIENAKRNIADLASSSWNIYKNYRPDYVSELLYYFAIFLNKNIFIETTGSGTEYLNRIIDMLSYYEYIPILIYPFINDVKIIYDRSIQRGLTEGRFLRCDTPFGLASQMRISFSNYPKMKDILDKYNNYLIHQYNSNFPSDIAGQLKNFNFGGLDNFSMQLKYRKQDKNTYNTITNTQDIISRDYDNLTFLSLEC